MKNQSKIAAIVDTETTGTAHYDEIIELGILLFEFNADTGQLLGIIDKYVGLREPSVPIHPRASQIHGLTQKDLLGQSLNKTKVKAMFNKAHVIIAHNVFINQEHRALGDVEHVYNLLSIIDKTTQRPYLYRLINPI